MANRRRVLIEIVGGALLVAALIIVWLWSAHERQEALADQQTKCKRQAQTLQSSGAAWAEALVRNQAEAVFRAYQAGIHAAVLADRNEALLVSVSELVRLPAVAFVHLLKPDGKVIVSSNQKFTETGQAGGRAAWALSVKELTVRKGDLPGTTEMATPIGDAAGVKAVLWMSYNTDLIKDQARPPTVR